MYYYGTSSLDSGKQITATLFLHSDVQRETRLVYFGKKRRAFSQRMRVELMAMRILLRLYVDINLKTINYPR